MGLGNYLDPNEHIKNGGRNKPKGVHVGILVESCSLSGDSPLGGCPQGPSPVAPSSIVVYTWAFKRLLYPHCNYPKGPKDPNMEYVGFLY